jgi:hypothetical protein
MDANGSSGAALRFHPKFFPIRNVYFEICAMNDNDLSANIHKLSRCFTRQ